MTYVEQGRTKTGKVIDTMEPLPDVGASAD
jgi:hypothetical protein